MAEIKQDEGRFFVGNKEEPDAEVSFRETDDIVIDHTLVKEDMQGDGLGTELIDRVVAYAQEQDKQIVPVCTFAHQVLSSNKKYDGVWEGPL
ncbi:GNAT family N-acetyltransferase [Terribacillus sp. DMT04]|uniref:GNAT family N-acetyltransferase n=1 Tax=Terribacillus sp. DMT04 TaxID=2850441 RepID=UPI001C2B9382|nr:GNAT family N-acetyltransferase [Terribacillus sp. DMT04]QXE02695.1 N-acetyltransferase [Terribacillus sp. DMT04]